MIQFVLSLASFLQYFYPYKLFTALKTKADTDKYETPSDGERSRS